MIVLGISCASLGCSRVRFPVHGSGAFRAFETEHIRLQSNGGKALSRILARELELRYQIMQRYMFPYQPALERPITVTFFRQLGTTQMLNGDPDYVGFYSRSMEEYTGETTILVAGQNTPGLYTQIATHELAHRLIDFHVPQAATWLHEGLSKYLESVTWKDDRAVFGRHPLLGIQADNPRVLYYFGVNNRQVQSLSQLRALDHKEFHDKGEDQNYVSSWAVVQALQEGSLRTRFFNYLDDLQSGKSMEHDAFANHFGSLQEKELLRRQRDLIGSVNYETELVSLPDTPVPEVDVRDGPTIPASEVHLLLARALSDWNRKLALKHARRALKRAPLDPEAKMTLGVLLTKDHQFQEGLQYLREAYEGSSRAPRYAAALLRASVETERWGEETRELAAQLSRTAVTAQESEALAVFLLSQDRKMAGLRFARRSVEKEPARVSGLQTLAWAHAQLGNYQIASLLQERAVHLSGHQPDIQAMNLLVTYRLNAAAEGREDEEQDENR